MRSESSLRRERTEVCAIQEKTSFVIFYPNSQNVILPSQFSTHPISRASDGLSGVLVNFLTTDVLQYKKFNA